MKHIPVFSLLFGALACVIMCFPQVAQDLLYFEYYKLMAKEQLWGLISGHWVHADNQHLLWNVAALALLGAIIEARSRSMLLWSIAIGTVCVDLLLVSPIGELNRYCGLSGLLNTLLGVALYIYWCETRSAIVVVVGILSIVKIAIEIHSGQSVFTDTTWPPFAEAHLAGILGTPVALWCYSKSGQGKFKSFT